MNSKKEFDAFVVIIIKEKAKKKEKKKKKEPKNQIILFYFQFNYFKLFFHFTDTLIF